MGDHRDIIIRCNKGSFGKHLIAVVPLSIVLLVSTASFWFALPVYLYDNGWMGRFLFCIAFILHWYSGWYLVWTVARYFGRIRLTLTHDRAIWHGIVFSKSVKYDQINKAQIDFRFRMGSRGYGLSQFLKKIFGYQPYSVRLILYWNRGFGLYRNIFLYLNYVTDEPLDVLALIIERAGLVPELHTKLRHEIDTCGYHHTYRPKVPDPVVDSSQ